MKITNEIKTRKIELIVIDSVTEQFPSYRVQILVETENIKTNFDNWVWISATDIDKFIKSIDNLDQTRKGQAQLCSMSPGELELTLKPIDNLGHIAATLRFIKDDRIANDYSFDIKVEFQIDPTSLPAIKLEMNKLKTHANNT